MSADALAEDLAALSGDPYRFVLWAFPWGEPGSDLERWQGPEAWQVEILCAIRDGLLTIEQAILLATASGHGVGKSALVAWIILWAISTYEDCRGVVTANTENQLKTKTWAELGKWHRLFIGSAMFKLTATALFQPERERTWRIDMVPWSERNTEAFAGLHNQGKRILIVYDEASRIADKVWEVSEGALTDKDTQIIWAVFGNPTRNIGRFKECFAGGKFASMWKTFQVDSRSVSFTNKDNFQRLIALHGEDSDYVRIRILGKFPRSGLLEFFRMDEVEAAMKREDAYVGPLEPVALGVDVARYGSNNSCIFPRKGRDARTTPRQIFNGLSTVDLAQRVVETITNLHADGVFVDGGGVGGGVVDYIRHSQFHCFDIQFGGKPNNFGQAQGIAGERYANKRAEMYGATRAWITTGMIPDDPDLKSQFGAITYYFNNRDEIILTSKEDMAKEGLPSPDDLDALCLTFAFPLASRNAMGSPSRPGESLVVSDYNPFDAEHMAA